MYSHFTDIQLLLAGFALVLIIIFVLATLLDNRWRKAAPLRVFGSDHKPDSLLQNSGRDDKGGSGNLHARYADLNARDLGTVVEHIAFRSKVQENPSGD